MEFSERLLEAINARAEGHKAFARAMKARGVSGHSYRTLRNYLTSATTPSPIWIEEAARELAVRLEWLRDGSGEMLYEEELASLPGGEAETEPLRGSSREAMDILAEVEAIFAGDLDRGDPVYGHLFRQITVTLASTGAVSLAQLVEAVREGDRAGVVYETYLTNYASSCRAVLKYVGTAARLLMPQREASDDLPLDPVISGIDLRHEYEIAAPAASLTPALIRQAQTNALEIAFLSKEEKVDLRQAKLAKSIEPSP